MSSNKRSEIDEGLQEAIIHVLKSHRELSSAQAHIRLRAEIRQRGLPCPPAAWLQAACDEIAHGHRYVVSKKTLPAGYLTDKQ